ncbi:MAG: S-adenosylmethionine:tRNA ribosyltransferase-isomerase, partial [Lachnospiraceae bacterium]|nr:S-adenosylmethionine:tRNA ribosyltransferase-isomerase [Lachnospiraceae bacterium]
MKTSDFFYDLPKELIAQDPLPDRSSSRLLVLGRLDGTIKHETFSDIRDHLEPGDCLVLNDTKVIPARLLGVKEDTGAAAEVFLLKRKSDNIWETLVRPGKKLRTGAAVSFGDGKLKCVITDCLPDGNRLVRFEYDGIFEEILDELGQMPLPPYITHKLADAARYQTVYAKYDGSAAAPTAGLHFTEKLLDEIREKGVNTCFV